LVNSAVHHLAEEFLARHVILSSQTWERARAFLLEGKGVRLIKQVKRLTIKFDGSPFISPDRQKDEALQLLSGLIETLGP
jgi:hypothetical protein